MSLQIDEEGNRFWFNSEDKYHRIDGPAYEWSDGRKWWYVNGKRHRTDGPAVEWNNGGKSWWVNGKRYTEEEYKEQIVDL